MRRQLLYTLMILLLLVGGCKNDFDIDQQSGKLFTSIPPAYSGLAFENTVVQTRENNHLLNVEFVSGGGVAVGDINNDGLPDIFFTANQASDRLYLNQGNLKFVDVSKKAGMSQDNNWSTGVTFVDIDRDGDQDIYVCRFVYLENDQSANQLYINNGDLTFSEQAEDFGIADQGFSTSATFCDFDKDNLVDLYVVNQPPSIPGRRGKISQTDLPGIQFSDRLYKNMGNGKFIDYTEKSNIRNFGFGLSALVGDFNDDSWQDIYVSNDFDVADHLYINNQDGTFTDAIKESTKHITNFSMGSDAADYDNDGLLDIMVVDMVHEDRRMRKSHMTNIDAREFINNISLGIHPQYMTNTLQRNNGNGTFSELARLAGVDKTGWSWGPLFADFDNDGWKDIFVTNGVLRNNLHSDLADLYEQKLDSLRQIAKTRNRDPKELIDVFDFVDLASKDETPNYLYKNNGNYTFSYKSVEWGMDLPTTSNGAAYADFDLDGDLDLVISNLNEVAGLYKNNTIENGKANYIRFKLNASTSKNSIGAKISIFNGDDLWQVQHITNTRGFRSKSEGIVHFGVGKITEISKVVIKWQDNTQTILENIAANQLYVVNQEEAKQSDPTSDSKERIPIFNDATTELGLSQVLHRENAFDDFSKQVLLPYKLSYSGPVLCVGDVNGDKKEDFFLGGSAGESAILFIQNSRGTFDEGNSGAWSQDFASEDTDAKFIDLDQDGDLDLLVGSGGNEFDLNDIRLKDRLYINNGKGIFNKDLTSLPEYTVSTSCIEPYDFDNDGDIDLFVGGRLIPGKYPYPANSYLLENIGGKFHDITKEKAPHLENLGLVTSAKWTDHNMDGRTDLVVVGEWVPITLFTQSGNGTFQKQQVNGLENSDGWYYEVQVADIDDDGDEDYIVGNLGMNYSYKASYENPLEIFSDDFDRNGTNDIVLSYTYDGQLFPIVGRERAVKQLPNLAKRYESYELFSKATLQKIYGESITNALHLKAYSFSSYYIENLGDNSFRRNPLPALAQASSIHSVIIKDFDNDGYKDLVISGNMYQTEIEVPRHDAGTGLFLKGNGKGDFNAVPIMDSGFFAPHDVREMKVIQVNGKQFILVGNNNFFLQAMEY